MTMTSCPMCACMTACRSTATAFVLDAVATPGHTANHICYALEEEEALFSGDHVMGWSTSVIAPPDGDMGQYLASLEKLRARHDRILLSHPWSPIADPRDWIWQLIAHRRLREAQILDAMDGTQARSSSW